MITLNSNSITNKTKPLGVDVYLKVRDTFIPPIELDGDASRDEDGQSLFGNLAKNLLRNLQNYKYADISKSFSNKYNILSLTEISLEKRGGVLNELKEAVNLFKESKLNEIEVKDKIDELLEGLEDEELSFAKKMKNLGGVDISGDTQTLAALLPFPLELGDELDSFVKYIDNFFGDIKELREKTQTSKKLLLSKNEVDSFAKAMEIEQKVEKSDFSFDFDFEKVDRGFLKGAKDHFFRSQTINSQELVFTLLFDKNIFKEEKVIGKQNGDIFKIPKIDITKKIDNK